MTTTFNADPDQVRSTRGPKVVFIHVGKCAGESVLRVLQRYGRDTISIFEMHCFDANIRIENLALAPPSDTLFVIAKRDPVQRFISAFNWDKHNLILSGKMVGTRYVELYEEFPTPQHLVDALDHNADNTRERARLLARFAHMGMGQFWYTPPKVLGALPSENLMTCDVKSLREDLTEVLLRIGILPADPNWKIPELKADYAKSYPNGNDLFQTNLSESASARLRNYLANDCRVYELLARP